MGDSMSSHCRECGSTLTNAWSELCSDCSRKARENFYSRIKSGGTCKHTPYVSHVRGRAPKRLPGDIHKRCPNCQTHVYVQGVPSGIARLVSCWKCGKTLRVSNAISNSTYHRGGIILNVVS